MCFFFFKQKTAYEMRISDWSSDVCSSDLCIACNQACWNGVNLGLPIACTINPAAGREGDLSEDLIIPALKPGHVMVIGGGPAGMEAARVARLKGHRVTLVEEIGSALCRERWCQYV